MMHNLDATGHQWVGTLASFQFKLEYQKGADNGATDALSQVHISHSWETIQSLLEGVIIGEANRGKVRVSEELLEEHKCLSHEASPHTHCGLGRSPGGRCSLSHLPQMASHQEGHTSPKAGHPS